MPEILTEDKVSEAVQFKREFLELCKKHGVAPYPAYDGEISFHGPMILGTFDESGEKFLVNRLSCYCDSLGDWY